MIIQDSRHLPNLNNPTTAIILVVHEVTFPGISEPVWAIGIGKVTTPAQAQDIHADLRKRGSRQREC
ncbi:triose-phosphate isomerase [Trifolium repens]|nr:triose-phosphate isomerase [Trifolium repens]